MRSHPGREVVVLVLSRMGTIAALIAFAGMLGCHGGSSSPTETAPALQCTSAASEQNQVVMLCGGQADTKTEVVNVSLGGPTTAGNIEGVTFDVVFDSTKVQFVSGSATQGTLLNQGGVQPLLAVALAPNDPNRLVVGCHRGAIAGGVAGLAVQNLILQLSFQVVATQTMAPVPLTFENAEAVDPNGAAIASIHFQNGLSIAVQ